MRVVALTALVIAACGGEEPEEAPVESPVAAAVQAPALAAPLQRWMNLASLADRAHLVRGGPILDPGAPGWRRVSALGGRGPWLPVRRYDDRGTERRVAYPEGIGASLGFPVGEEGPSLRKLTLWMGPMAPDQYVSVFLDEEPVSTVRVRPGGRRYSIDLPMEGIKPGEHHLRFWFRRTRWMGKHRTPAFLDQIRLEPGGEVPDLPDVWTGALEVAGAKGEVLFAGPPTAWSYYLRLPYGARLQARTSVVEAGPVSFLARVQVDGEPPVEGARVEVAAGTATDLEMDLSRWGGQLVRLTLATEGPTAAVATAGWMEPVILAPAAPAVDVPPVRNVIVWAVDGLRTDRVALNRGGDHAATPNLDLIAAEGAAAVKVWTGGASPDDGHRDLLRPSPDGPGLAALLGAAGRQTGFLSASTAVDPALVADFQTKLDLHRAGEPPETRILMRELDAWLYARKRNPFFLYVASDDPRVPFDPAPGYEQLYQRIAAAKEPQKFGKLLSKTAQIRAAYDALVSTTDYWVSQLSALLYAHGVAEETAIIIVGTVGQELREHGGLGDGHALVPEVLWVPMVVWHPKLRRTGEPRPLVEGGDLVDIAATVLRLAGVERPPTWPGRDLAGALFYGQTLTPHPSHARLRYQFVTRDGEWLMRGAGGWEVRLWNLDDDPLTERDLAPERPIAVRVLRDSAR